MHCRVAGAVGTANPPPLPPQHDDTVAMATSRYVAMYPEHVMESVPSYRSLSSWVAAGKSRKAATGRGSHGTDADAGQGRGGSGQDHESSGDDAGQGHNNIPSKATTAACFAVAELPDATRSAVLRDGAVSISPQLCSFKHTLGVTLTVSLIVAVRRATTRSQAHYE